MNDVLTGTFHVFDTVNRNNGRIYDSDIFNREIEKYKKKLIYDKRKKIINKLLNE